MDVRILSMQLLKINIMKEGDKIKGFKFKSRINGMDFIEEMEPYVGQTGRIFDITRSRLTIQFDDGMIWSFPRKEAYNHLVK